MGNFNWKNNPAFMGFALQQVEDQLAQGGSEVNCNEIVSAMKQHFGSQKCCNLTASSISRMFENTVRNHKKNQKHTLKDFLRRGAGILNLNTIGCTVIVHQPNSDPAAKSNSIKRSADVVDEVEQPLSKRQKRDHVKSTKKRTIQDTSSEEDDDDDFDPRPKHKRKIAEAKSQGHRASSGVKQLSKRSMKGADDAIKSASSAQTGLQQGISLPDPSSNRRSRATKPAAPNTKNHQTVDDHSNKVQLDDTGSFASATEQLESEDEEVQQDKVRSLKYVGSQEAEKAIESNHAVSTAATQKTRKLTLKYGSGQTISGSEPSGQRSPHPRQAEQRATTGQMSHPFDSSDPWELKDFGNTPLSEYYGMLGGGWVGTDNYVPSEPRTTPRPHSPEEIHKAMKVLSHAISETVTVELMMRGIDGNESFHLDIARYDEDDMKLLHKIFGYGWSKRTLKAQVNDAQTKRLLKLRTFLESWIGASVSSKALEPLPQGEFNRGSSEYDMYRQLLRLIEDEGLKQFGFHYQRDSFSQTVQLYALRNHILQRVLPKLDDRATELAHELRGQLMIMFSPEPDRSWIASTDTLMPTVSFNDGQQPADTASDVESLILSEDEMSKQRTPPRDILFNNLKKIFKFALSARAVWEAWGDAQYEFHWHSFGAPFEHHEHQPNEFSLGLDKKKKHEVFVGILPSIWTRYRANRLQKWTQPNCISKAVVLLKEK